MDVAGIGKTYPTPVAPMFFSVTEQLLEPCALDNLYWVKNMCGTVRFFGAVANFLSHVLAGRRALARAQAVKWNSLIEIGLYAALKALLV